MTWYWSEGLSADSFRWNLTIYIQKMTGNTFSGVPLRHTQLWWSTLTQQRTAGTHTSPGDQKRKQERLLDEVRNNDRGGISVVFSFHCSKKCTSGCWKYIFIWSSAAFRRFSIIEMVVHFKPLKHIQEQNVPVRFSKSYNRNILNYWWYTKIPKGKVAIILKQSCLMLFPHLYLLSVA